MMYAIDFGFFPLVGLLVGGGLYALYYWFLRLRCQARWAQAFIVGSMVLTTVCSVVSVARLTERQWPANTERQEAPMDVTTADTYPSGRYHGAVPTGLDRLQATETRTSMSPQKWGDELSHDPMPTSTPTASAVSTNKEHVNAASASTAQHGYAWMFQDASRLMGLLWLCGVAVMLVYFLTQLVYLYYFRSRQEQKDECEGTAVYETTGRVLPFSFGRNVFLPAQLTGEVKHYVLLHELSHVRHRHFRWLCMLELLVAANWWNPFVWLLFGEMRLQQELEVDADVVASGVDRQQYQLSLVSMSTGPGKWILMQSAFFGEPLKKRLLFMNTTINPSLARTLVGCTLSLAFLVLTVLAVVSCRAREREVSHPLQGCWELDWVRKGDGQEQQAAGAQEYKFFGDYGEVVLTYGQADGVNMPTFHVTGWEQHVRGDSIFDVKGRPVEYHMEGPDRHIYHWKRPAGELNVHPGGVDWTEQWHRATPDPRLISLMRYVSTADMNTNGHHEMNGVWLLDSVMSISLYDHDVTVRRHNRPHYLVLSDPYYMRISFAPDTNEEVMDFMGHGDCGEFSVKSNGFVELRGEVYSIENWNPDWMVLSINESKNPGSDKLGIYHYFYHRIPMPRFLARMFRPALLADE